MRINKIEIRPMELVAIILVTLSIAFASATRKEEFFLIFSILISIQIISTIYYIKRGKGD